MISEKNHNKLIKGLIKRTKFSKFDGINLDCTQFWVSEDLYPLYVTFQQKLHNELNKLKKNLIITLFPYSETMVNIITKPRVEYLSRYTDYIVLMTYDYLNFNHKNDSKEVNLKSSPEPWVIQTLDHYIDVKKKSSDDILGKILLGYSFHGFIMDRTETNHMKGNIIEGKKLKEISKIEASINNSLIWNEEDKEYYALIDNEKSNYIAIVPSIRSINKRIELIDVKKLGGISVWEVGQGYEAWIEAL